MTALIRGFLLSVALLISWQFPISTDAACTVTTADLQETTLQTAINAASSGDTICLPPGTSPIWPCCLVVQNDVTIQGSGIDVTIIQASGPIGQCFFLSNAKNIRITNLTVDTCIFQMLDLPVIGKTFRIDHIKQTSATFTITNDFSGSNNCPAIGQLLPTGLLDHNIFHNARSEAGGAGGCDTAQYVAAENTVWAQQPLRGDQGYLGVIYLEDNIITSDRDSNFSWIDGNRGGRFVARFNTMSGVYFGLATHTEHTNQRGLQFWEWYGNTIDTSNTNFGLAWMRSGSGFGFSNILSASTLGFALNNGRSQTSDAPETQMCDGTSLQDGNANPNPASGIVDGWPCRDQIGRSYDSVLYVYFNAYQQPSTPAYFWDNLKSGSLVSPGFCCDVGRNPVHIVANRDYYTEDDTNCPASSGGNCTGGVGFGTFLNRPGSCTIGTAYWAYNQGSWMTATPSQGSWVAGRQGQLYICTAPNIWTLYYGPLIYPHPLATGLSASPPSAPTGVIIQ